METVNPVRRIDVVRKAGARPSAGPPMVGTKADAVPNIAKANKANLESCIFKVWTVLDQRRETVCVQAAGRMGVPCSTFFVTWKMRLVRESFTGGSSAQGVPFPIKNLTLNLNPARTNFTGVIQGVWFVW